MKVIQEIYDAGKGSEEKSKGSQALCEYHRYTLLGLLLQWRSLYQMFYLKNE